jgi:Rps23 Pro-64 3,4-dihydroxylase Tpa1-like proline 4-hydroxylase
MRLHEVFLNLSQNFTQDETLLSLRERELLASIWRHAQQFATGNSSETERVETILTFALGETLLQRISFAAACRALEEVKQQSSRRHFSDTTPLRQAASPPPSPSTGPRPPSPSPGPGPGTKIADQPLWRGTPIPSSPGPGSGQVERVSKDSFVAVQDKPELQRAQYVALDEFLAPEELKNLTRYVLAHEGNFQVSEVISPGVAAGVIDPEYRRSRVLLDLGKYGDLILSRVQAALPLVLEKLGMQPFPLSRAESQVTASNHGDFFRHHSDNAEEEIATRELTFVYFFHREPKAFDGGELRLYDAYRENDAWFSAGEHRTIVPEQNQMILFRSSLLHEITPVVCPSQAFADSRFTVNGWLHR